MAMWASHLDRQKNRKSLQAQESKKSLGTIQGHNQVMAWHNGTSKSGKNKRTTLRIPTWSPTVVLTEPEGA